MIILALIRWDVVPFVITLSLLIYVLRELFQHTDVLKSEDIIVKSRHIYILLFEICIPHECKSYHLKLYKGYLNYHMDGKCII
jgi:hypothetical protein